MRSVGFNLAMLVLITFAALWTLGSSEAKGCWRCRPLLPVFVGPWQRVGDTNVWVRRRGLFGLRTDVWIRRKP